MYKIVLIFLALQLVSCSKPSSNQSNVVNKPKSYESLVPVTYNPIRIDIRENDHIIDISTINFGDVFVGTKVIQNIVIKNNSTADVTPNLSNLISEKFILTNNCSTLIPRSSCALS